MYCGKECSFLCCTEKSFVIVYENRVLYLSLLRKMMVGIYGLLVNKFAKKENILTDFIVYLGPACPALNGLGLRLRKSSFPPMRIMRGNRASQRQ
jgi:hypothetical protein